MEGDRATTAISELEIFSWQVQLKGERATTAIWELERKRSTTAIWKLEIFGDRSSWKETRLQLQSWNSIFLVAGSVGRQQSYNSNLARFLGGRLSYSRFFSGRPS